MHEDVFEGGGVSAELGEIEITASKLRQKRRDRPVELTHVELPRVAVVAAEVARGPNSFEAPQNILTDMAVGRDTVQHELDNPISA